MKKRFLFTLIAFVAASGLILGLTLTDSASTPSSQITYRLDWDWGQATPHQAEPGWDVTNDLSYQVWVQRGYLVTGRVQLVPCEDHDHSHTLNGFIDGLRPQPAYAGHGGEQDESKSTVIYVESLIQPNLAELETISVPQGASYCQAHYLVTYAGKSARNLPDNEMIGISLLIEGVYRSPDGVATRPFTIQTNLAWGIVTELTAGSIETGSNPVTVTIRRNLGTMFDGVDFDHVSETERAKTVLRSLTQNTKVFIETK